jgi:predicted nucleotidyltransferase
MRLTPEQRRAIREATAETFGPGVEVKLFGSRLDDTKRGGDIDLLLESSEPIPQAEERTTELIARIQKRLGLRKIDVIYAWPGLEEKPVHHSARREGVPI